VGQAAGQWQLSPYLLAFARRLHSPRPSQHAGDRQPPPLRIMRLGSTQLRFSWGVITDGQPQEAVVDRQGHADPRAAGVDGIRHQLAGNDHDVLGNSIQLGAGDQRPGELVGTEATGQVRGPDLARESLRHLPTHPAPVSVHCYAAELPAWAGSITRSLAKQPGTRVAFSRCHIRCQLSRNHRETSRRLLPSDGAQRSRGKKVSGPSHDVAINHPDQLAQLFTDLGRDLSAQESLGDVLKRLTERSVTAVPGAELAGITRAYRGRFETVAPTDERTTRVDQLQYDLRSGPCVDAILDNTVYRTGDVSREQRWAEFGRRAAEEEGIHSVLSVRFFLEDEDVIAGLNIYASHVNAFDESAQTIAMLLATHGALALTAARLRDKTDNLERALKTSRTIGMAMGILMANHKLTEEHAFDLLRIASQHTHTKLADIATKVTETGALDLPKLTREQQRRGRSRPIR
jgi:hypothetical protein